MDERKDENYIPLGINAGSINIIVLRANVMNISARFQLYPSSSFGGVDFLNIFVNLAYQLPWQI